MISTLASNWCFFGIDQTQDWHLSEDLMRFVDKIITVYSFDRNAVTHCCETTPNYWLCAVAYEPQFKPDTPEHIRDKVLDLVSGVAVSDSDGYYHTHVIDRWVLAKPELFYEVGDIENDTVRPDETMFEIWSQDPKF